MAGDEYSFAVLLQFIEDAITTFPGIRKGKNTVYEVRDAILSAFAVFFLQSPSFLPHQREKMRIILADKKTLAERFADIGSKKVRSSMEESTVEISTIHPGIKKIIRIPNLPVTLVYLLEKADS